MRDPCISSSGTDEGLSCSRISGDREFTLWECNQWNLEKLPVREGMTPWVLLWVTEGRMAVQETVRASGVDEMGHIQRGMAIDSCKWGRKYPVWMQGGEEGPSGEGNVRKCE